MKGVAHCALYGSILPRDEFEYFRDNAADILEKTAQDMARAKDRVAISLAIANSTLHQVSNFEASCTSLCADFDKMKGAHDILLKEKEVVQQEKAKFQQENEELVQELGKFKQESERFQLEKDKLQRDYDQLAKTSTFFQNERDESTKKFSALHDEHKQLDKDHGKLKMELESLKEKFEADKKSLVENAICDYRQSIECYRLKTRYGVAFIKIGYYKCRFMLESMKKESFPELVYTKEIEVVDPPNWRELNYAPNEEDPETHLSACLHDDLSNLTSPWTFFGEHGLPSPDSDGEDGMDEGRSNDEGNLQIESLGGLDEESAQDPLEDVSICNPPVDV